MGVTSNTGLLPSKKTKCIQYLQKPPVHLRAIAVPAPYTLKPFAGLYNPFPYGCSLLCNHPADTEAKDLVRKAKETWAAEGKSLLLAEEVAAIRAGIEQFQAAQSDQQSDKNTSDNMDSVPEGLFRRYTETDSRPLTPAPTIASTYTRASASRRCVTPDPVITAQFKEKTRLILDLRRSHSQETLSWFGGGSSTEPPIIRIQQAPTRSVTPESNLAAQKDHKKKSPRSLQQSPVCKKAKADISRPKTEFPRMRNDTKSELRPPNIHLEVTPPKESTQESSVGDGQLKSNAEEDEDVMKRRGKKRHKKGRDSSRGPPVQQSIDPETQVATIGIDSHNPSARTSLIPNSEQEMDDDKIEEKRKSSLDVNSYLDKDILRQLRRELNEEIVDNEFDLKRRKALEEALKAVQVEKVTCDELKMLQQELKIPVINVEFWLSLPRTFSRSSARFELPMDSTTLSNLTPMDYIKENINITSSRRLLYNCIFNRHKVEYEEDEENQERIMSGKEIPAALGEMMGHPLSQSQLDSFKKLVGWSEEELFDFKTFCGLCALCERLLAPDYYPQLPSKQLDPCHEIEVADFESLERRLRGQTPDERLKRILFAIKNS